MYLAIFLILSLVLTYLILITILLWTGVIGQVRGEQGDKGDKGDVGDQGEPVFGSSHMFVSKNGNDKNDGLSWESSFLTIPKALTMVPDHWTIIIGPGTYDSGQELVLDKNVCLESFEGKETTVLTRNPTSNNYRIISMHAPKAMCVGFTIENGVTSSNNGNASDSDGGNVYIDHNSQLIDCLVQNGNSFQYGGNIYIENGFVTRCEVTNGSHRLANGGFGSGIYVRLSSVVDTCYVHDNNAGLGAGITLSQFSVASIVNCTIINNDGTSLFGVLGNGVSANTVCIMRNNIIWGNTPENVTLVNLVNGDEILNNNYGLPLQILGGVGPTGPDNITTDPLLLPSGTVPVTSPCFQAGSLARSEFDINLVPRLSVATPTLGAFNAV